MDNFQLYRTNLLLGGQMKWDIILDSDNESNLHISKFYLSPISNNIPYTYTTDIDLLKNTHQDNIKSFYETIKGHFYDEGLSAEFNHDWPIISKKDEVKDVYCNIYDMGCKRSNCYNKYNKQFEFFCPVWLEHLQESDELSFIFTIRIPHSDAIVSKNILSISPKYITSHDKFVKYFNEYASYVGLNTGSDDVMNINMDKNITKITGLNPSNGLVEIKNVNNLINNITLRERPLLETDYMIINSFKDSLLIAKQLFNFNLCFNMQDVITNSAYRILKGSELVISVDVMINDKLLDKKDFYTEYEFIPKHITTKEDIDIQFNVLDYLYDYKNIDLINKNKFCKKICHWSLVDNNDYIFNVYNGFSGLYVEKNDDDQLVYYENDHQYGNAANTYISFADKALNSLGWINTFNVNSFNEFSKYIYYTNKYKELDATYISSGKNYINNIKYNNTLDDKDNFYIIGLIVNEDVLSKIKSRYENSLNLLISNNSDSVENGLYAININDFTILITTNDNLLSFGNFQNFINDKDFNEIKIINYVSSEYKNGYLKINFENQDNVETNYEDGNLELSIIGSVDEKFVARLSNLKNLMNGKIDPCFITFNGGLKYGNADGPLKSTDEITYFKDNSSTNYVIRYDGKIKPTFTDVISTIYYKDYISDDRLSNKSNLLNSNYIKYVNSGYLPHYPSIEYCSIKNTSNWSYTDTPEGNVSEHENIVKIFGNNTEYSWFNNGRSLVLIPELKLNYTIKKYDENYNNAYFALRAAVSAYYNTDNSKQIDCIISKYDVSIDLEYITNEDNHIDAYKYIINMLLK